MKYTYKQPEGDGTQLHGQTTAAAVDRQQGHLPTHHGCGMNQGQGKGQSSEPYSRELRLNAAAVRFFSETRVYPSTRIGRNMCLQSHNIILSKILYVQKYVAYLICYYYMRHSNIKSTIAILPTGYHDTCVGPTQKTT